MNAQSVSDVSPLVSSPERWPEPLTLTEWDREYPGVMDAIGIVAGPANVVMQLAHPAVGHGVVESRVPSGQLFRRPFKRARTTLTYLAVAMLGTTEEKKAYRRAVSQVHAKVYSTEASPVSYSGLDPELQLWVAACLYWGVEDFWTRLRGPQDPEKLESLYRRLVSLGTTLQVRPEMWPADRAAFQAYWREGLSKLKIDDEVRSYLLALIDFKFVFPVLRFPAAPLNRFVTSGLVPSEVREQLGLEWNPGKQRRFDRMMRVIGAVNRRLPRVVRVAPTWLMIQDLRFRMRHGWPLV